MGCWTVDIGARMENCFVDAKLHGHILMQSPSLSRVERMHLYLLLEYLRKFSPPETLEF
jgi:hypothetical protein